MMDKIEIAKYLTQSLNMALDLGSESSYTNSFGVVVEEQASHFVPRLPSGYLIDNELYFRIFVIANVVLYPRYTVLKQNSAYFTVLD